MANASLSHEPPQFNHQMLSNAGPYEYHGEGHPHRNMSDCALHARIHDTIL